MSENLPTSFQLDTNQNGSVTFATDVIATIAALAANEVEGVASMSPTGGGSLADILVRRGQPSRNLTKGVKVDVTDGRVSVHVSIIVDYGCPVPEVAASLQENVKKAVETMSGLVVDSVDVHVQGVSFERENRAAAEIEMHQRVLLTRQNNKNDGESAGTKAAAGETIKDAPGSAGAPNQGVYNGPNDAFGLDPDDEMDDELMDALDNEPFDDLGEALEREISDELGDGPDHEPDDELGDDLEDELADELADDWADGELTDEPADDWDGGGAAVDPLPDDGEL